MSWLGFFVCVCRIGYWKKNMKAWPNGRDWAVPYRMCSNVLSMYFWCSVLIFFLSRDLSVVKEVLQRHCFFLHTSLFSELYTISTVSVLKTLGGCQPLDLASVCLYYCLFVLFCHVSVILIIMFLTAVGIHFGFMSYFQSYYFYLTISH